MPPPLPPHAEFLSDERIYLRPVEPDDVSLLHQWANNPELRGLIGETRPSTYAATLEYYEKVQNDPSRLWLAVVVRENQQLIGEAMMRLNSWSDFQHVDLHFTQKTMIGKRQAVEFEIGAGLKLSDKPQKGADKQNGPNANG